jgi:hypothetical protein
LDSLAAGSPERKGAVDAEAQWAARDAIMQIPQFPELERRLVSVLGPTSEALMIHQLVYWFDKPKMQNRRWAYKTYKEWKDERGLNRKQVDKGRKRSKALGLLEEKHGNYKRLHYRVDWVRLAELLSIPLKGGQSDEWDDLEDDPFSYEPLYPLKGAQSSSDTPKGGTVENDTPLVDDDSDSYAENPSFGEVQYNAREHPEAYEQDNTLYREAPEPAFAEPSAPAINKKEELKKDDVPALPGPDKRHSQTAQPPKPKISKEREVKAWGLIFGLPDETDASRFADRHIAGNKDSNGEPFTVERVAEKVRELLGGDEPLKAYMPWVERCLGDKRAEAAETEIEAAS